MGERVPPLTYLYAVIEAWTPETRPAPLRLLGGGQKPGLNNSATTQAQIQDLDLAHPKAYPIYELLEPVKGWALQNHGHRVSMTLGNSRMSISEGPVSMVVEARGPKPDQ